MCANERTQTKHSAHTHTSRRRCRHHRHHHNQDTTHTKICNRLKKLHTAHFCPYGMTKNIFPVSGQIKSNVKTHTHQNSRLDKFCWIINICVDFIIFLSCTLFLTLSLSTYHFGECECEYLWVDGSMRILMPTASACIILHDLDWVITFNVCASSECLWDITMEINVYGAKTSRMPNCVHICKDMMSNTQHTIAVNIDVGFANVAIVAAL